jgi:hypothetical protein
LVQIQIHAFIILASNCFCLLGTTRYRDAKAWDKKAWKLDKNDVSRCLDERFGAKTAVAMAELEEFGIAMRGEEAQLMRKKYNQAREKKKKEKGEKHGVAKQSYK